eukprot:TRINITY_DN13935_c0_g1_i2.p1 TRINITY_DN13935_c0_g1~~TRINITY_DN13935_c0_g1_i2.p1  ORF type:complete len:749 (+),score=133.36 TRINITY_DN13935_c0_g1_i2:165-2411(+)
MAEWACVLAQVMRFMEEAGDADSFFACGCTCAAWHHIVYSEAFVPEWQRLCEAVVAEAQRLLAPVLCDKARTRPQPQPRVRRTRCFVELCLTAPPPEQPEARKGEQGGDPAASLMTPEVLQRCLPRHWWSEVVNCVVAVTNAAAPYETPVRVRAARLLARTLAMHSGDCDGGCLRLAISLAAGRRLVRSLDAVVAQNSMLQELVGAVDQPAKVVVLRAALSEGDEHLKLSALDVMQKQNLLPLFLPELQKAEGDPIFSVRRRAECISCELEKSENNKYFCISTAILLCEKIQPKVDQRDGIDLMPESAPPVRTLLRHSSCTVAAAGEWVRLAELVLLIVCSEQPLTSFISFWALPQMVEEVHAVAKDTSETTPQMDAQLDLLYSELATPAAPCMCLYCRLHGGTECRSDESACGYAVDLLLAILAGAVPQITESGLWGCCHGLARVLTVLTRAPRAAEAGAALASRVVRQLALIICCTHTPAARRMWAAVLLLSVCSPQRHVTRVEPLLRSDPDSSHLVELVSQLPTLYGAPKACGDLIRRAFGDQVVRKQMEHEWVEDAFVCRAVNEPFLPPQIILQCALSTQGPIPKRCDWHIEVTLRTVAAFCTANKIACCLCTADDRPFCDSCGKCNAAGKPSVALHFCLLTNKAAKQGLRKRGASSKSDHYMDVCLCLSLWHPHRWACIFEHNPDRWDNHVAVASVTVGQLCCMLTPVLAKCGATFVPPNACGQRMKGVPWDATIFRALCTES